MRVSQWISRFFRSTSSFSPRRRLSESRRLQVETLEGRLVPAASLMTPLDSLLLATREAGGTQVEPLGNRFQITGVDSGDPLASILQASVIEADARISDWAGSAAYASDARAIYGRIEGGLDDAQVSGVQQALLNRVNSVDIRLVDSTVLPGAMGAYTNALNGGQDTILVNRDWVGHPAAGRSLTSLLLEEYGHSLDLRFNGATDSPGDEGQMFATVLTGTIANPTEWAALRGENDQAVAMVDGQVVSIEMATAYFVQAYNVTAYTTNSSLTLGTQLGGSNFSFIQAPNTSFTATSNNVIGGTGVTFQYSGNFPPANTFTATDWLRDTNDNFLGITVLEANTGTRYALIKNNPGPYDLTPPQVISIRSSAFAGKLNTYAFNSGSGITTTTSLSSISDTNGVITNGGNTSTTAPVVAGTISAALTGTQTVGVFRNGVFAGNATVTGTNWSFTDSIPATNQTYVYSAQVLYNVSGTRYGGGAFSSNYTINRVSLNPTTVTLAAPSPSTYGDAVTFTATVTGGSNYQGSVSFFDNGVALTGGTYNFNSVTGVATYSISTLNAGTRPITAQYVTGAGDTNATSGVSSAISQVVNQRLLTVSLQGVITKAYDGTTAFNALTNANYLIGNVVSGQSFTINQTAGAYNSKDVATATSLTASLTGGNFVAGAGTLASNYSFPSSATGSASITKRDLSVVIQGTPTREYDGTKTATLTSANYNVSGTVLSETFTINQTVGTFNTKDAATANSVTASLNAGNFVASGGSDPNNYILPSSATGSADITERLLTASIIGTPTKVYDGSTAATLAPANFQLNTLVAGEGFTVTQTNGTYNSDHVTEANNILASLSSGNFTPINGETLASNYSFPVIASGAGAITPKALTGSFTSANKPYDGTTTAVFSNPTLTGVVGSDVVNLSITGASFSSKNIGTQAVTASGASLSGPGASDYSILSSNVTTTATILAKELTISGVTADNKPYDGTTTATLSGTGTLVGVVSPDVVTLGGSPVANFNNALIGNAKPVIVSGYTLGGADAGNYTLTQPSLTANITVPLSPVVETSTTVTADLTTITYGDADVVFTVIVTPATDAGMMPNGSVILYAGATVLGSGFVSLVGLNYQATITVSKLSAGTYRDGTGGTLEVFGVYQGDPVYKSSATNGSLQDLLTVEKRGLTVTFTQPSFTKEYDGTTGKALTSSSFEVTGEAVGESFTISQTTGNFNSKNVVGTTNFAADLVGFYVPGANTALANYTIQNSVSTAGSITPRTVSVSIQGTPTKTYDRTSAATLVSTNFGLTGLVSGEEFTVTKTTGGYFDGILPARDAGSWTVETTLAEGDFQPVGTTDASNYTLPTLASGPGEIFRAVLTVSIIGNPTKPYDGNVNYSQLTSANYSLVGVAPGDDISITKTTGNFNSSQVLAANTITTTITPTDYATGVGTLRGNYLLATSASGPGSITPLELSGSFTTATRVYDGKVAATPSLPVLSGTIIGADSVSLVVTAAEFDDKNVGVDKPVTATTYSLAGAQAGNYELSSAPTSSGTITQAELTVINLVAENKTFDNNTTAEINENDTVTLVGVIPGDTVDLEPVDFPIFGNFDSIFVGTNKPVTINPGQLILEGVDAGNYYLTLPTLFADITASGAVIATTAGVFNTHTPTNFIYGAETSQFLAVVNAPSLFMPTGEVALYAGALLLGTVDSASDDWVLEQDSSSWTIFAFFNIPKLAVGTYGNGSSGSIAVTAVYGGDSIHIGSTGNYGSLPITVSPKALQVSFVPGSFTKVYDGTSNQNLTPADYLVSGAVEGESFTINQTEGNYDSPNVAEATTVTALLAAGNYVAGAGTSLSNYTIDTSVQAPGSITARSLGVVIAGTPQKIYDGNTDISLNSANYEISSLVEGEVITITQASGTLNSANAGSRVVTADLDGDYFQPEGGALLTNYIFPTSATGQAEVTRKLLSISLVDAAGNPLSKVYDGDSDGTLIPANYLLEGVVDGESFTVIHTTATYLSSNAGPTTLSTALIPTDYQPGPGTFRTNYQVPVSASGLTTILPKTLTGSFTTAPKVYDGTKTATVSAPQLSGGIIGTDNVSLVVTAAEFDNANVGTNKPVTATAYGLTGAQAGNYTLDNVAPTSTGTITAQTLTITGLSANDKPYDKTATATLSGTPSLDGVVDGETIVLEGTPSATFNNPLIGTLKPVTVTGFTISGDTAGNYLLVQPSFTASITFPSNPIVPTSTTVTADQVGTFAYASQTVVFTATVLPETYAGIDPDGEIELWAGATLLGIQPVVNVGGNFIANFTIPKLGVGNYENLLAVYYAGDDIYLPSNDNAPLQTELVITPKALTVNLVGGPYTKTYDGGTLLALTSSDFEVQTGVAGESFTITATAGNFNSANVADATTFTVLLDGVNYVAGPNTSLSNYTIQDTVSTSGSITKKSLTVDIAGNPSKIYDGSTGILLASEQLHVSGTVGLESFTVLPVTGDFNSKDVADATTVTADLQASDFVPAVGTLPGNYDFPTLATGAGDILGRVLTASIIGNPSKQYDGTTGYNGLLPGNFQLNNLVPGEGFDVTHTTATFNSPNVLLADELFTGLVDEDFEPLGSTLASNYVLPTTASGPGSITAKALTGSFTAQNKVYDGTAEASPSNPELTGVISGDDVTLAIANALFNSANVGTNKPVTASVYGLEGTDASNYLLDGVPETTADITAKALTVTANSFSKAFGVLYTPTGTEFTSSGLVSGDSISSVTLTSAGFAVLAATGTYSITPSGATGTGLDNYAITYVDGTLTVTPGVATATYTGSTTFVTTTTSGSATVTLSALVVAPGITTPSVAYQTATVRFYNAWSNTLVATATPNTNGVATATVGLAGFSAGGMATYGSSYLLRVEVSGGFSNASQLSPVGNWTSTTYAAYGSVSILSSAGQGYTQGAGNYTPSGAIGSLSSNLVAGVPNTFAVSAKNGVSSGWITLIIPRTDGIYMVRATNIQSVVTAGGISTVGTTSASISRITYTGSGNRVVTLATGVTVEARVGVSGTGTPSVQFRVFKGSLSYWNDQNLISLIAGQGNTRINP